MLMKNPYITKEKNNEENFVCIEFTRDSQEDSKSLFPEQPYEVLVSFYDYRRRIVKSDDEKKILDCQLLFIFFELLKTYTSKEKIFIKDLGMFLEPIRNITDLEWLFFRYISHLKEKLPQDDFDSIREKYFSQEKYEKLEAIVRELFSNQIFKLNRILQGEEIQ